MQRRTHTHTHINSEAMGLGGKALHIWGAPAARLGSDARLQEGSCGRGGSLTGGVPSGNREQLAINVWDFLSGWNHHIYF